MLEVEENKKRIEKLTYTVREMGEALGIGASLAYTIIHRKDFPKIKLGSRYIIPVNALEKWLLEHASWKEEY